MMKLFGIFVLVFLLDKGNFIECLRCAYDCSFVAFPLNVSIPITVCKHQERDNAQCSVILEIDFESQLVSGVLNIENRYAIASLKTETKFKLKSNSVISTIWYTCTMSDFCDFEFINELLTNKLAQINATSLQQKLIDFLYTPIPSQINIQCSNRLCSWNSFCQSDFRNIFTPQYNYTYIDGTLPCIQISQNDQFIKITQQYLPSAVQLSEMNMRCNVKQCNTDNIVSEVYTLIQNEFTLPLNYSILNLNTTFTTTTSPSAASLLILSKYFFIFLSIIILFS
ncbi:unnamed protein product [Rotaria sordida]|uniref:Uncharacterized protein n=1 Tax=Rotaria sordida TaxID=392033 RepID=A0A819KFL7_9BILA|nr:unnamed protein product [Rotaria sordida]CAF3943779.1 unnamed protein product [Rotaria sordida]